MPIDPEAAGTRSEPHAVSWSSKDCLLYALGVGAGVVDPTGFELEFTTENSQDVVQKVLPTFPVVLSGGAGVWAGIGTFDPAMLVHGEQTVTLHAPLPVEGEVSSVTTITGIYDKGSGALVVTDTVATTPDGSPLYTTTSSGFIRGAGGWGGDRGPSNPVVIPARDPDDVVVYPTRPDQALLYRLSGDRNPLHSDPRFAALGGFDRPILHGLCTFGFTGRALLHTVCQSDPDRFVSMAGRFSRPVFPGQDLTVSIWRIGDGEALYRTASSGAPGGAVVIDSGRLTHR